MSRGSTRGAMLALKSGLDRLLALVLAIALAPLLALIGLAIKADDRGPLLFVQPRLGKGGIPFRIYKFRSMVVDADALLDEQGRASKPRVTRVGKILRRSSLDELPQLLNILRGEMSFIGPRPPLLHHADRYTSEQWGRLRMKPGVTGLAQVSGRNTLKWSERIALDNWYIDHYSLLLDVKIVLRTVGVVFSRRGVVLDRNPEDVDDLAPPSRPPTPPTPPTQ